MRDTIFRKGYDGEPLVTVTLDAIEVQEIACALSKRAAEHTSRVFDKIVSGKAEKVGDWRGVSAQMQSNRTAGEWSFLQDQMDRPFWDWVNANNGEHDCGCQCHIGTDVAEPVCSICLCSQED